MQRMAFLRKFTPILIVALVIRVSTASVDYYTLTLPSYSGKVLQSPAVDKILLFNLTVKDGNLSVPSVVNRDNLDARCRMKCLTMGDGSCKSFQTYWTLNGIFYCELLNTTLCNSCAPITDQAAGQLQARVWEVIQPGGYNPVLPCHLLPDWKVPGNCSLCGKIGFYGRNCSLRSSCASYYYENPSPQADLSTYTDSPIQPCFTEAKTIYTWCRGPFTLWFSSYDWFVTGFWSHGAVFPVSYSRLKQELEDTSKWLGSLERNLLVVTYKIVLDESRLLYSGFSLGPDGSLTLKNLKYVSGRILLKDGFQTPIVDAPFLRPITPICGPMWLSDPTVFYNSTHTNTCDSYSSVFADTINRWAGVDVFRFITYVDVDYFQC